jgi:hypothetical protein
MAIPLLIEGGDPKRVDRVLVVDVSEDVQLQRVMSRDGGDSTQARAILAAQRICEVALAIDGFQEVPRKNRDTVEKPLSGGIRLGHFKSNRVLIHFFNRDRFAAYDQKISLGRIYFFVQVDLEAEHDVVGIEGLPVRESQAAAEPQRVLSAITGCGPGFCKSGFGLLRAAIDMNQVRRQTANHVARRCVLGQDGIQRFRFRAHRKYEPAAAVPRGNLRDHGLFGWMRLRASVANRKRCGSDKDAVIPEGYSLHKLNS